MNRASGRRAVQKPEERSGEENGTWELAVGSGRKKEKSRA